jgi:DNA invertase Pin-like site-specific DNA recombinase
MGRMVLTVLGMVAEMERDSVPERGSDAIWMTFGGFITNLG